MRRFVEEADRGQRTLLPECLDDFIDESNPVRVIDVFVGALGLAEMGFEGVEPAATGRPSYHPSVLLKLYIYGYLNRVQSSRRLEREAGRNVEVMWLLGRLAPDHKTIAATKVTRLTEKLTKLKEETGKLAVYEKQMLASPDQQISLTDPDSRSMATSGRGSGVVGYNVQVAVDTEHHLIVTHEVTNSGSDRAQLANMAKQAKGVLKTETLEAVADRGYFSSPEIFACHEAGITVTLPKPMTSGAKSDGRFGKQDFVYLPEETPIVVRPGSDCRIAIQTKKPTRCCGATGPTPVRIVRSNPSARPGQSDGSRDGSTRICSTPCSSGSMRTRSLCAFVARRSSIRSAR